MRLQILSDVHAELHRDGGGSFVAALEPAGIDVLVLAGDIGTMNALGYVRNNLSVILTAFSERYAAADVLFVLGNHEHYGIPRARLHAEVAKITARQRNLHWLDDAVAIIKGRRFVGTTLWFPRSSDLGDATDPRAQAEVNDFEMIAGFTKWVFDANATSRRFLERELRPGDAVVTHYLPSPRSIAPEFMGSKLNPFFVSNVEPVIRASRPALWVHGHSHASMDYVIPCPGEMLTETRVVSNPFGYAPAHLNPRFARRFTVDLQRFGRAEE